MRSGRWAVRVAAVSTVALLAGFLTALPASALGSPTVTTLDSSQNPSAACGSVTLTATVHGALFPDSPLGAVQFFDGGSFLSGPQIITPGFDTFLGAHVVPTNHSSAKITVSLSGGTHVITVVYGGTDIPSSGGPLVQNVTAATSTTAVTSTVNPTVFGQSTTFNAAVTSSCSGSVSGSVQFQADGVNLGPSQPVDGSGHASFATSALPVGSHPISAVFTSSNSDVQSSTGTLPSNQVVNPADTSTTVASSTNPSEFGASVAFTATTTVTAPGAGTPTGRTQFADNGTPLGSAQPLDGTGKAMVATSSLSVGVHTIGAAYSSNSPNFNGSSGSLSQQVNRARTTLTYDGATTADYHDPAVLSATLTRTDSSAPIAGKTVLFTMGAESCSQTTGVDGKAACTVIPSEPASSPGVTTSFAGDGNYLPSSDTSKRVIIFAFPAHGIFLLGDHSASGPITYWGAQWATVNGLSGGSAPSSFKGFAAGTETTPPSCGTTWTSSPGNSSSPVGSVPAYMGTAVTTTVTKNGAARLPGSSPTSSSSSLTRATKATPAIPEPAP